MMLESSAHAWRARVQRDQQIVRATAELISAGLPLERLFEELCPMLARFVDATQVFVALRHADGARIEHLWTNGHSIRGSPRMLNPQSQTMNVLRTGASVMMNRVEDWPGGPIRIAEASHQSESAVYVPLRLGNDVIGVLSVQTPVREAYTSDDLALLETCGLYLAVAVGNAQLVRANTVLEGLATIDPLTGISNRRAFDERLRHEWQRAARSKRPLSIVIMDIDFFKAFNDTYGHVAGDACLQQIARVLAFALERPADILTRYDGKEFAAILPETGHAGATAIAEKMRAAAGGLHISHQGSTLGIVTMSVGVATCIPAREASPYSLIESANSALHEAKSAGRNRVAGERYRSDSPVVAHEPNTRHNLPAHLTSFLGRHRELAEITALLGSAPLVTLTGAGGVGKTRLLVRAAAAILAHFPDGVRFVEFAPVSDPALVESTVVSSLGLRDEPGRSINETLVDHIGERRMLLVLDNCEHVVKACSELVERLLRHCPQLVVAASSREALRIAGEVAYRIPSLTTPEPGVPLTPASALGYEAIALFADRASQASPSFVITSGNVEAVAQICRRLDGIPLAIELAAARVRMMRVERLAELLDDRFALLSSGSRTAAPRQQTLRALIDWSYNLLTADERVLLNRLAVFGGGWSLEAAREVCAGEPIAAEMIFDLVTGLVDKSLILPLSEDARQRYLLLESTRAYARERLGETGEMATFQQRHVAYYRNLAEHSQSLARAVERRSWFDELKGEYDNVRAALHWAVNERGNVDMGAQLVAALGRFWLHRGELREGRYWIERTQTASGGNLKPILRAQLLRSAGWLGWEAGDFAFAKPASERAVEIFAQIGNRVGIADARNVVALITMYTGNFVRAEALFGENLELSQETNNVRGIGIALSNMAILLAECRMRFDEALPLYQQALAIYTELNEIANMGIMHSYMGELASHVGDYPLAMQRGREGLRVFEELGNHPLIVEQLARLGKYELQTRNLSAARSTLRYALAKLGHSSTSRSIALCFDAIAMLALAGPVALDGAKLLGFVNRWRSMIAFPRFTAVQHAHDAFLARLGIGFMDASMEQASSIGAELTLAQSFALARAVTNATNYAP